MTQFSGASTTPSSVTYCQALSLRMGISPS
jgi:hypothetical protein